MNTIGKFSTGASTPLVTAKEKQLNFNKLRSKRTFFFAIGALSCGADRSARSSKTRAHLLLCLSTINLDRADTQFINTRINKRVAKAAGALGGGAAQNNPEFAGVLTAEILFIALLNIRLCLARSLTSMSNSNPGR